MYLTSAFNDLRHYAASIMHVIGIPDQYILQRGGWASDNVMKAVYRNVIDLETARQNRKINEHFKQFKNLCKYHTKYHTRPGNADKY